MTIRIEVQCLICSLVLSIGCGDVLLSQGKNLTPPIVNSQQVRGVLILVQNQYQSIAEEAIAQLPLDAKKKIELVVDAANDKPVIENAFLRTFQAKGISAYIRSSRATGSNSPNTTFADSSETGLQITLLEREHVQTPLAGDAVAREIRTTLEVQWHIGQTKLQGVLGPFERVYRDTVEKKILDQISSTDAENDSWINKFLAPLAIIGGSVLIIYLFFAVRS